MRSCPTNSVCPGGYHYGQTLLVGHDLMFYELIWTWVFVFCLCFPGIFSKIPLNSPKFLTKWRQKSWNLWLQWKSIVTFLVSPQDTSDEGRGLTLLEKARMSLGEGSGWGWPPSLPNCFRRKGLRGGGCTQKVGFWIGVPLGKEQGLPV